MLKKEGFAILLFMAFILNLTLVLSEIPSPVVIEGYVSDIVTGDMITNPIVSVKIGDKSFECNTALNSPGNHNKGHYDSVALGIAGDLVKISAYDRDNPSCKVETSRLLTGDGRLEVNVELCCFPNMPTELKPDKPLHLKSLTSVDFSWVSGSKGNSKYPDLWNIFKGPKTVQNPTNPLKLEISNLDGWSLQTCNGIKNTNQFCCVEKTVGVGYQNHPCNPPINLKGYFKNGFVVTSWDSESEDEDGDICFDEWKASSLKEGDNLVNPSWTNLVSKANKLSEIAPAYLATFWQVRSCDDQGKSDSCSEWVSMITSSCNEISNECPDLFEIKDSLSSGGLNTEVYCNGIKLNKKDFLKRINLKISKNTKEISIINLNGGVYDLDYCPWCYDGIKDYDEIDIDCGGSCKSCDSLTSLNSSIKSNYWILIVAIILIVITIIILRFLKKSKKSSSNLNNIKIKPKV